MSTTGLSCQCGKVRLEVSGAPIIAAECHCTSCREAGQRMSQLPGALQTAEANGGTQFVMYRKDRVRFISGLEQLAAFRLGPERTTRRVIARCCNTPIFLEFKGGHWLSLYSALWAKGTAPAVALRTMTSDRPGVLLDQSVPAGGWETAKFYGRLLGAWIAMGFKSPEVKLDGRQVEIEPAAVQ